MKRFLLVLVYACLLAIGAAAPARAESTTQAPAAAPVIGAASAQPAPGPLLGRDFLLAFAAASLVVSGGGVVAAGGWLR